MKFLQKVLFTCSLTGISLLPAFAQHSFQLAPNAAKAHEQWHQLTKGEELARGKKVLFYPAPDYNLTTDKNDPYDLTDGTLSAEKDDRIWWNKDSVGWFLGKGMNTGRTLIIDLGSVQPVGQIAIRVLGGGEVRNLDLPFSLEFLASADGKQYYSLQKMTRLLPKVKDQANFVTNYYAPETGKAFMLPLMWRGDVRARYIAIRTPPQVGFFTDQISVLKAADSGTPKDLQSFPETSVITSGLLIKPRHDDFAVTTNVLTPRMLDLENFTNININKNDAGFRLEMPKGLHLLPQTDFPFTEITASKPGMICYQFSFDGKWTKGPLWIAKDPNVNIPPNSKVTITSYLQGKVSNVVESPLKLVKVPEVPPLQAGTLDISLAWTQDKQEHNWPNFLQDFHKMGFNYVATFPRSFSSEGGNTDTKKSLDFLQQALKLGYGIVYDESPFHIMWAQVQKDIKSGKMDAAEQKDFFTQIDGTQGKAMNLLYRGKYFQDEIARVARLAATVRPDLVFLDIEWWDSSVRESKDDPRVIAAWKQSGKSWDDFVTDTGTAVLGTLVNTMRKAVPEKKLVVGLYNSDPGRPLNNKFFQWNKIYPGIIDIAQPSFYRQGRVLPIRERVRADHDDMQNRQIIPWLTAGTYGEFDPRKMEPMVLESILNGARGVTYFALRDFEPLDFYYHAQALHKLAPYQDLLKTGKPISYQGDNKTLYYTGYASKSEAFILVGNYGGSTKTHVDLPIPIKNASIARIVDGAALTPKNNCISVDVPAGEFRLIYWKQ